MFKYKTEAELTAMTAEQRDTYSEQKRAWETTQTKAQIDAAIDAFKAANPIPAAVELPISKEEVTEIKETLNQLKESNGDSVVKVVSIAKQLKENKEKIKQLATSKAGGSEEVVIKADTVWASIATNNHYLQVNNIGQLGTKLPGLYDICAKITVGKGNHQGTIAYTDWDEASIVRSAAAVAENTAFAESTAKFKGYTLALRKIGDTLPVSEEFFEDEELAASQLNDFLTINVATARDTELVTGDNTGQHLNGLMNSTSAYVAAAAGILNANIYDLIVKMRTAISTTRGSKYREFKAVMNQSTADKLVLAKDLNGNYQFDTNHPIWNMIAIDNNMANDAMVVGDFRFAKIYEMGGIALSSGHGTTGQFEEDMMILKARLRLAFLIRAADATGFLKSTTVTADIATIQGV